MPPPLHCEWRTIDPGDGNVHEWFITFVDKYPSTTAHTISAADALKRLQKIGGVEFEDTDQSALKTIREKRNEIEH